LPPIERRFLSCPRSADAALTIEPTAPGAAAALALAPTFLGAAYGRGGAGRKEGG
jgi:hypothetical protein